MMLDIRDHGGNFGGKVAGGNYAIDVFKDLNSDFPLEKPIQLNAGSFTGKNSCYDICGDHIVVATLTATRLYKISKNGLDSKPTLVTSHSFIGASRFTLFAIANSYYAIAEMGVSPWTVRTYNLLGQQIASLNFPSTIQDIKSDGEYLYIMSQNTIQKYSSALGSPIATLPSPSGINNVIAGNYLPLFVPKGDSNPYFYLQYGHTSGNIAISKHLKSTLAQVGVNTTNVQNYGGSHIIGVDYELDKIYVANCNSNRYVSIIVLDSTMAKVWDSGTFDYNSGTASYVSNVIFGKDDASFKYKSQNGTSYGFLTHRRINRKTFANSSNYSSGTEVVSLQLGWYHIAYDENQKRMLKSSLMYTYPPNGDADEINMGFYKI